jgi:SAM-dependent methyltransferase
MVTSDSEELVVRQSADRMYSDGQIIWHDFDRWHLHTRAEIEKFIERTGTELLRDARSVLDAGCGRDGYEWMPVRAVSLDRFYEQVRHRSRPTAGDLEALPFADAAFDLVVCVGSVLNYVSALEAINELARVTRKRGHIFLQFETSSSFEQIGRRSWNASAKLNTTVNSDRTDHIWIYSPKYVQSALAAAGFRVIQSRRFHVLSALLTRLGVPHQTAALAARFDRAAWCLNGFADNLIVLAEKT